MDKLTPDALITFLWVAAAIVAFTLSVWALIEKIKKAKQPARDLEQWQKDTAAKLDKDKKRIDSLEDGQRAMCRGILAILNHEITGNSVDSLKKAKEGLSEFLISK